MRSNSTDRKLPNFVFFMIKFFSSYIVAVNRRYPVTNTNPISPTRNKFDQNNMFNNSRSQFSTMGGAKSINNNEGVFKRRITDATSEKELMKAMSTFLNRTGAGDYNLPKLTGEKVISS
jgi:hypothetical protein